MKKIKIIGLSVIILIAIGVNVVFAIQYVTPSQNDLSATALNSFNKSSSKIKENKADTDKKFAEVGGINNEIIAFSKKVDKKDKEALKLRVAKRKQLMNDLAKSNPGMFLSLVMPSSVRKNLPADVQKDIEIKSTVTGTLKVIHVDDFDNHEDSYFEYFIESKNTDTPLYLSNELEASSGGTVSVTGYTTTVGVVAYTSGVDAVGATPEPTAMGDQKTLVLLVTFLDSSAVPFTQAAAHDIIFNSQFQKYYNEQSYGQTSFSGDVYGWVNVQRNTDWNQGCSQGVGTNDATIAKVITDNNINLANYGRVVYLLNRGEGGCSGVGKFQHSFNGTNYSFSESWISVDANYSKPSYWSAAGGEEPFTWTNLDYVMSHEVGHALGLLHANGLDCDTVSMQGSNCQHIEYGNNFDVMGNGSGLSLHFNAFYKELLGWIKPASEVLITGSGTYTINPLEASSSVKKLAKITLLNSTSTPFYIEYRRAIGFDSNLATSSLSSNQSGLFLNYIVQNQYTPFSRLIDLSPTSQYWWDDTHAVTLNTVKTPSALNSFTDAGTGVTITAIDASSTAMRFSVKMVAPTCVPGTPMNVYSSGIFTSVPGGFGYFNVGFENTDSIGCGGVVFDIVPTIPSSWTYTVYPSGVDNVAVASNQGVGKYVTYSIPSTATPGNYTLTFDLINRTTGQKQTFTQNVTVVPAPVISSVTPASGLAGTEVTIKGTNLTGEGLQLYLQNGISVYSYPPVTVVDANTLKFTVPASMTQYCTETGCPGATTTPLGLYRIDLYVNNAYAGDATFLVGDNKSTISVLSPNGGESLVRGTTQNITWTSQNIGNSVRISLYKANVWQERLAIGAPNNGSYTWTIPSTHATGTNYTIKVMKDDDSTIIDGSDANFSIVATPPPPPAPASVSITGTPTSALTYDSNNKESQLTGNFKVNVTAGNKDIILPANTFWFTAMKEGQIALGNSTAPQEVNDANGTYRISAGTTKTFTLTPSFNPKIMFAGTYTISFQSMLYSIAGDSYNYSITPSTNSTNAVTVVGELSPYITSISTSTVANGTVVVDGKRFAVGDTVTVMNQSKTFIKTFSITSTTGTQFGFVPTAQGVPADVYFIVVKNTTNGESNSLLFGVTPSTKSTITVTAPNGGEVLTRGTTQPITWTSQNIGNSVRISLYKANVWQERLAIGAPNNGSYTWTIPSTHATGTNYTIKVMKDDDSTIIDGSDANFTITQ